MLQVVFIALIRAYQRGLRPILPPACRFHPTCSAYALEAIARRGALGGALLAARRVLRCHPWHPGGYDPVLPREAVLARPPQGGPDR